MAVRNDPTKMSDCVRNGNAAVKGYVMMNKLDIIYSYYSGLFGASAKNEAVEISKYVADGVSSYGRTWTWRYLLSVKNETMEPSRFIITAIDRHYNEIMAKMNKDKKPRPNYRLRPLQIRCSERQYKRLLKLSTAMRAIILLKGVKDHENVYQMRDRERTERVLQGKKR